MVFLDLIEFYLRRWKRYDSHQSRKRLLILVLVLCIIFIYSGPFFFRLIWHRTPITISNIEQCSEHEINTFLRQSAQFEGSFWTNNPRQVAYVGNGKFGVPILDISQPFYISGKRALDKVLPFYPIVEIKYDDNIKTTTSVSYVKGLVNKVTCIPFNSKSVSIIQTIYAHRLIPTLLVQEIDIVNPSNVPFTLELNRIGWKGSQYLNSQALPFHYEDNLEYFQIQNDLNIDNEHKILFSIILPQVPDKVEVPSRRKSLVFKTFLNYTLPTPRNQITSLQRVIRSSLKETSKSILNILSIDLYNSHINAWSALWQSGFGISFSKASNALNGDKINKTIYHILSQKRAYSWDTVYDLSKAFENFQKNDLLFKPDSCYNGHSTLGASSLFFDMNSIEDINNVVSLWLLTLEKHGCHNLIESGAMGTMQAIIMSLGALKFTKHHLEFNSHPKELHRDYFIRRLWYGNTTLLNITVILGEDNKAIIYAALDKNKGDRVFYGCDGGCLDAPVQLSSSQSSFPVKLTDPLTAILYITPDKQHIEELKHTIHVKEVVEAPAQEHHIVALHRHGHQLGGLPAMFWLSIVFLIVVFHLFLAKLIYNEYCASSSPQGYERVRYAV